MVWYSTTVYIHVASTLYTLTDFLYAHKYVHVQCYNVTNSCPVPGLMGSQLEARLHKARSTHFYCRHTYDSWYRLWLSLDDILPVFINCFKENIKYKIEYNISINLCPFIDPFVQPNLTPY